METVVKIIEIFALVTGVPYVILEVLQKKSMWYFGIATGLACAYSFAVQHLWANMGLNVYYVVMAFWGLYQWKKDGDTLKETDSDATIHLSRLSGRTVLVSLLVFLVGTAALIGLLHVLNDSESAMDAIVTVMSAVAMVWLGKSYPQHWYLWIVADSLLTVLCLVSGMYWMAVLYLAYIASSVIGLVHWKKNGKYIN